MLRRMEVPEPVSEPVSPLEVDKERAGLTVRS